MMMKQQPPTPCDSMDMYMNGGRLQYQRKDAHIMIVVNEKFKKKRVRCSPDRLVCMEGGKSNPNATAQCVETLLGETQGGGKKKNFDTGWYIFFRG